MSVAIPASLVSDVPHLREKSIKIGLIGRAAAIFRVDEVIVFSDIPDVDQSRDADLITTILSYMETPQYLRKRLFKIKPELRYAGIVPPLGTPHHPLSHRAERLKTGEYREGVVTSSFKSGSFVDVGVERPVLILYTQLPINTRVTVRIAKLGKRPRATLVSQGDIKTYWGYHTTISDIPFGQLIRDRPFDLAIATSRHGIPIKSVKDKLVNRWKRSRTALVAFGSPSKGLYDIVAHEHLKLENLTHFVINTVPKQGTETVRTEEALYATLACLNILISGE